MIHNLRVPSHQLPRSTAVGLILFLPALLFTGCSHGNSNSPAPSPAANAAGANAASTPGAPASTSPPPANNIASQAVAGYGQNIHGALDAAKRTACASNLSQLRTAIRMQTDFDGHPPTSLSQVNGAIKNIENCPETNAPYQYDPATARVYCTTPGHESL